MENQEDFGDFEEVQDPNQEKKPQVTGEAPVRVRLPREGEMVGVIMQRLGGNRMEVQTSDGKTKNCRVPGRFKRTLWLRPKDVVLVELWEHDADKGDVIFKYIGSAINQLRKRGLLDKINNQF